MTMLTKLPSKVGSASETTDFILHREAMRLESLRLALDTVVEGSTDRSGNSTASAVLTVAARYLEYIVNGPAPDTPRRPRNASKAPVALSIEGTFTKDILT